MVQKMLERQAAVKAQIELLTQELKFIQTDLSDHAREVHPKAKYGNLKVTVMQQTQASTVRTYGESIRITMELLNKEEMEAHLDTFGTVYGDWKELRRSVEYFRKGTVLTHDGGGYLLLDDCVICSDEEWEELKKGNLGKFGRLDQFQG